MQYKLVVVAGEAKQPELVIKPPTVIGRSRDADITLGHPLVSRRHCEITVGDDGLLVVEDLGSLNGTFHGDERITEAVYLEPGDLLTIGSVTFRAQYGENGAAHDAPDFAAVDEDKGTKTISFDDEPKPASKGKRATGKAAAESDDSFDAMFADMDSPPEPADDLEVVEDDQAVEEVADFAEADDEVAELEEVVEEEAVEEEFVEELEPIDEADPEVAAADAEVADEEELEEVEDFEAPAAADSMTVAAPASPVAKAKPPQGKTPGGKTPEAKPKQADDFDMGWLSGDAEEADDADAGAAGKKEHAASEEGDGDLDDFFKNLG